MSLEIEGFPFEAASSVELSGKGLPRITFQLSGPGVGKQNAGVLPGDVFLDFLIGLALDSDDGSQNADALLALFHAAAKPIPCVHARALEAERRRWTISSMMRRHQDKFVPPFKKDTTA